MFPFLRTTKQYLLVGLLWSPISAWAITLLVFLANIPWGDAVIWTIPPMILKFFFCLSLWYLCRTTFQNQWPLLKTIWFHLLSATLITAIWLTLIFFYSEILAQVMKNAIWNSRFLQAIPVFAAISISLYFITILSHYLILVFENKREVEKEALKQKLLAGEAEIRALKATVHPHFLFNCLNLLPPLMTSSINNAKVVISQLSDFLLYSLRYGKQDTVTLRHELEHIKNYLAIESVRLGERLKLEVTVDEKTLEAPILPLSLLPLAENAIKHGINQCLNGGTLKVTTSLEAGYVRITMHNPTEEPTPKITGQGLGLTTLKERFTACYGSNCSLITSKGNRFFQVELHFPYFYETKNE